MNKNRTPPGKKRKLSSMKSCVQTSLLFSFCPVLLTFIYLSPFFPSLLFLRFLFLYSLKRNPQSSLLSVSPSLLLSTSFAFSLSLSLARYVSLRIFIVSRESRSFPASLYFSPSLSSFSDSRFRPSPLRCVFILLFLSGTSRSLTSNYLPSTSPSRFASFHFLSAERGVG